MALSIFQISLLVRDYDEAIDWYRRCLAFELIEDIDLGADKRWVVMRPPEAEGAALLLARAVGQEQIAQIGKQAGGRVFLFLQTNHFDQTYALMKQQGVVFLEAPRSEAYGRVVVFEDISGNRWDLIEPAL